MTDTDRLGVRDVIHPEDGGERAFLRLVCWRTFEESWRWDFRRSSSTKLSIMGWRIDVSRSPHQPAHLMTPGHTIKKNAKIVQGWLDLLRGLSLPLSPPQEDAGQVRDGEVLELWLRWGTTSEVQVTIHEIAPPEWKEVADLMREMRTMLLDWSRRAL